MSAFTKVTGQDAQNNGAKAQQDALNKQNELLTYNKGLRDQLKPYFDQYLQASGNPLAGLGQDTQNYETAAKNAGFSDPYSSANTELESGAYRDDQAAALQRSVAAIRNAGMQPGTVGSSNIGNQTSSLYANAAQENAAYARQLRIRAGQERYTNYIAQRDKLINNRYRNLDALGNTSNTLMNVQGAMSGNIGGIETAGQNLTKLGQEQQNGIVQLATAAGGLTGSPGRNPGTSNGSGGTNQHGNTSWTGGNGSFTGKAPGVDYSYPTNF